VRVRNVGADQFPSHVKKILDSPEDIWLHAFEEQISNAARNVLFALYASAYGEESSDLEVSWQALHRYTSAKYNFATSPRDFRRALSDLEVSFIKIEGQKIDYLNPSIRDFIENIFCSSRERVLDVINSATTFRQIIAFRELWEERKAKDLAEALMPTAEVMAAVQRLASNPHIRWRTDADGRRIGTHFDTSFESRISALVTWAEEAQSKSPLDVAWQTLTTLESSWKTEVISFRQVVQTIRTLDESQWVFMHGGAAIRQRMLDGLIRDLNFANYYTWGSVLDYRRTSANLSKSELDEIDEALEEYRRRGVDQDIEDCESSSDLEYLRTRLVELQKENSISFKRSIKRIATAIAARAEPDDEEDDTPSMIKSASHHAPPNEKEIRRLFSSLLD